MKKQIANSLLALGAFLLFALAMTLVNKFFTTVNINAILITAMVLYVVNEFRISLFEYLESKDKKGVGNAN